MRKSLLLAMAVAIAATASAQVRMAKSFATPKDIVTEQPAGQLVKYQRSGEGLYVSGEYCIPGEQNAITSIVYAEDGTTVYINNIFNDNATLMGDAWVTGNLNEDKTQITVPMGQAIYHSASYNADVVLAWGSTSVTYDASGNATGIAFTPDASVTEVVYNVDPATGVITMTPGEGNISAEAPACFNATGLGCYWTDDASFGSFLDWNLTLTPKSDAVPAVPADPTLYADSWFDSGDEDGYSCLDFLLPKTDVDGNDIDPTLLSFSIFTDDDQIFTFTAETYPNDLTQDMTEIPYSVYHGGYDFDDARIYFYRTNAEGFTPFFGQRIGIQVYYTVDGEKNASNIVYWNLTPDAIETVDAGKTVDNAWYNLAGVKFVGKPSVPGIYINNGRKVVIK